VVESTTLQLLTWSFSRQRDKQLLKRQGSSCCPALIYSLPNHAWEHPAAMIRNGSPVRAVLYAAFVPS
jgi:hypothetical protein